MTGKTHLRNDVQCVGRDIKPYSLAHSLTHDGHRTQNRQTARYTTMIRLLTYCNVCSCQFSLLSSQGRNIISIIRNVDCRAEGVVRLIGAMIWLPAAPRPVLRFGETVSGRFSTISPYRSVVRDCKNMKAAHYNMCALILFQFISGHARECKIYRNRYETY